jgi:hypothetical protein
VWYKLIIIIIFAIFFFDGWIISETIWYNLHSLWGALILVKTRVKINFHPFFSYSLRRYWHRKRSLRTSSWNSSRMHLSHNSWAQFAWLKIVSIKICNFKILLVSKVFFVCHHIVQVLTSSWGFTKCECIYWLNFKLRWFPEISGSPSENIIIINGEFSSFNVINHPIIELIKLDSLRQRLIIHMVVIFVLDGLVIVKFGHIGFHGKYDASEKFFFIDGRFFGF